MGRAWPVTFLAAHLLWSCARDRSPREPVAHADPEARAAHLRATDLQGGSGRPTEQDDGPGLAIRGRHAALRSTELEVLGLVAQAEGVQLEVRFANRGGGFALWPQPLTGAIELVQADGRRHRISGASEGFLERLSADGLEPGTDLGGGIFFATGPSEGEAMLLVPGFEPLHFDAGRLPVVADASALTIPSPASAPSAAGEGGKPTSALAIEISSLLGRHASALARTDFTSYLDTFSPAAHDRERRILRQARQVPFTEVRLELEETDLPSPSGNRLVVSAEMTYRLDGQDENNPFLHPLRFELERDPGRADGEWRIAAVRQDSRRPVFWRQPSLALHRTHHFLIYVWPSATYDVLKVAGEAEAAYAAILQRGLPLAGRYVAHVVTDAGLFRRVVGTPFAVGAAITRQVASNGRVSVDSRAFYLNGPLLHPHRRRRPSAEERQTTIAHELVHLALSEVTRSQTPLWVSEGTAVYFSGGLDDDATRRLVHGRLESLSLDRLAASRRFGGHDDADLGERARDEYLYAANLIAYLVRHYGRDVFLDFYRSFGELPLLLPPGEGLAAKLSQRLTAEGLASHFELTPETLEAAVKQSLRLRYR